MARKLRSDTDYYLIGFEEYDILGAKLPTLRQVLKVFFFHHHTERQSLRESSKLAVQKVKSIWSKSGIKTREDKHCIDKLEAHYKEWQNMKKSKGRKTLRQSEIENAFIQKLEILFDIAHAKAIENCKFEEDKEFLIAQRQADRTGSMGVFDKRTFQKEKRRKERIEKEEDRKKRHIELSSQSVIKQCTFFCFNQILQKSDVQRILILLSCRF